MNCNSISLPPLVIIGFGNQAKAWAMNLRDSGHQVFIALQEKSSSRALAEKMRFPVLTLKTSELNSYRHFILLTPDHTHEEILLESQNFFPPSSCFIYAHGFSVDKNHLTQIDSSWRHLLLAPKSIASELRFQYETGGGISGIYSVEFSGPAEAQEKDRQFLFTLAKAIGINVGPFASTFARETHADLFSEQSLLCSLLPYASLACYKLLRDRGIEKELAYLECWHELKLIANALVTMGPVNFFQMISPNALIGAHKGQQQLLNENFQRRLENLLEDILQNKFYQEVDEADYQALKKEMLAFWEKQELTQTYRELAPQLYKK